MKKKLKIVMIVMTIVITVMKAVNKIKRLVAQLKVTAMMKAAIMRNKVKMHKSVKRPTVRLMMKVKR